MQKIPLYTLLATTLFTIGGCKNNPSNPLEAILNAKIKDHELTWQQAAKQFSYCQEESKQWRLIEEREDGVKAGFSCMLTTKSIAPINEKLKNQAQEIQNKETQYIENKIKDYTSRQEQFRQQFKETYAVQCENCDILQTVGDKELDQLALFYYQNFQEYDKVIANPIINALKNKGVILDVAFFELGNTLNQLSGIEQIERKPASYNPIQEIAYELELWHWIDKRRIQTQGEFDGDEKLLITFADGETEMALEPTKVKYLIENENPIDIISRKYTASQGIFR